MRPKLTVFIPTAHREYLFKKLYQKVLPWIKEHSENVQLVCAIQDEYERYYHNSDNVKIIRGNKHHIFIKNEDRRRLFNYLRGFSHCDGEYTFILEDDDIPIFETLDSFLNMDTSYCLYVYDIVQKNQKMDIYNDVTMSAHEFVMKFPDIFMSNFQWGQCITKTCLLHDALRDVNILTHKNPLVRMDELCTLYGVYDENVKVSLFKNPILYVGVHNDNYSWNTNREYKERHLYMDFLKKYVSDDTTWLSKMSEI